MTRMCSINGCERLHYGRGWCRIHYHRWYLRGGDPSEKRVGHPPTLPINHQAFAAPLSAQAWYWLGFLGADGCVGDRGEIMLRLAARDLDHIKAFREFVGGEDRRITGPHKGSHCLTVRSRPMAADLARSAGIVPRKSLTYDCGDLAAQQPAFWLGLLDGDGVVYWHKDRRSRAQPELRWLGAYPTMERCREFLGATLERDMPPVRRARPSQPLRAIGIGGARARLMAALLLNSAPYSLPRKRARLETFTP